MLSNVLESACHKSQACAHQLLTSRTLTSCCAAGLTGSQKMTPASSTWLGAGAASSNSLRAAHVPESGHARAATRPSTRFSQASRTADHRLPELQPGVSGVPSTRFTQPSRTADHLSPDPHSGELGTAGTRRLSQPSRTADEHLHSAEAQSIAPRAPGSEAPSRRASLVEESGSSQAQSVQARRQEP